MTTIFYLSATGNSLYAAKKIQEYLNSKNETVLLRDISQAINEPDLKIEGNVGLVMPLHFFAVPLLAEAFIEKLNLSDADYSFAVITAGWHYMSDAMHELRKLFAAKGVVLRAGFYIDMVSIYLPLGAIPPEEKTRQRLKKADKKLQLAANKIAVKKCGFDSEYLGIVSRLMHNMVRNKRQSLDKDFWLTDDCTGCGLCEKVCPTGNLVVIKESLIWQHKCTQCLACMHICPQSAIQLGGKTKGKQRYHHPNIERRELLKK